MHKPSRSRHLRDEQSLEEKSLVGARFSPTLLPRPLPQRLGVSEFAAILPNKMGAILAIGGSLPTVVQKADGR